MFALTTFYDTKYIIAFIYCYHYYTHIFLVKHFHVKLTQTQFTKEYRF